VAKQPVDLCTSGLSQVVAREYLRTGRLPAQLERIRGIYSAKRDAMLAALGRHFPQEWGVRWTRPEGGLFLWMTLPGGIDARALLERTLERNVAFVTGRPFHCDGSGDNTLRLNFSYPTLEQLDLAAACLARCVEPMLDRAVVPPAGDDSRKELVVAGDHALEQLAWNLALGEVVE
jgi:2-aminoadipate transaminase